MEFALVRYTTHLGAPDALWEMLQSSRREGAKLLLDLTLVVFPIFMINFSPALTAFLSVSGSAAK